MNGGLGIPVANKSIKSEVLPSLGVDLGKRGERAGDMSFEVLVRPVHQFVTFALEPRTEMSLKTSGLVR
ncbi:hypothetical protein PoB_007113800 [Plakobranchus ocellatus]|uniref:Uncharacterized protein n=1 Tax=Plakobranchus ocellatus TaxID=259542 RepID=A0AAV4DKM5_9GAST|nr:hypothetical protein PoB_007113800 [Plakobranchus ocellatus]